MGRYYALVLGSLLIILVLAFPDAVKAQTLDLKSLSSADTITKTAIPYFQLTPIGSYMLTARPHHTSSMAGPTVDLAFSVVSPLSNSSVAVASLSLINTDTNSVISPITDGMVLDLSKLPTKGLSIRANTEPAPVGSVYFELDPVSYTHTEHAVPYDLCNDTGTHGEWALPCSQLQVAGAYTLTATPIDSSGVPGQSLTVHFSVLSGLHQPTSRFFYGVNKFGPTGSISVYDIDAGHELVKTIQTVSDVALLRGVAASAKTGKLYVSYYSTAGTGMIYCLDLYSDTIVWEKVIPPNVDRLSIDPDGQTLYVPTSEDSLNPTYNYINLVDAATGNIKGTVQVAGLTHDTLFPLSGPIFQECKMLDGSCNYLYMIDPSNYHITLVGSFSSFLGPFSVDGASAYAVANVNNVNGMQVANLVTGEIVTALLPSGYPGGLFHGIGWTPDQSEVWQSTGASPNIAIWDMSNPMAPRFKMWMPMRSPSGSHWLTFSIAGDYGYVAPQRGSTDPTEIFNVFTHQSVGFIASTEEMLEVDFTNGVISAVGDQYGIGRKGIVK